MILGVLFSLRPLCPLPSSSHSLANLPSNTYLLVNLSLQSSIHPKLFKHAIIDHLLNILHQESSSTNLTVVMTDSP